jgi:hypothetical protein
MRHVERSETSPEIESIKINRGFLASLRNDEHFTIK